VRGELSAFFGDQSLEDDIYLRTWGIPTISKKIVQNYDQETLIVSQQFCNGINAYIDQIGNRVPPEFKILGKKPIQVASI